LIGGITTLFAGAEATAAMGKRAATERPGTSGPATLSQHAIVYRQAILTPFDSIG
jgi:hypothetical protein